VQFSTIFIQQSETRLTTIYTSDVFVSSVFGVTDDRQRQTDPEGRQQRPANSQLIAHRCDCGYDDA